jgi:5'-3' exoribonuclease 1
MARASEILRGPDYDARLREVKAWLKSKGVRDFEPVSLFCDVLSKVSVLTAHAIQCSTWGTGHRFGD